MSRTIRFGPRRDRSLRPRCGSSINKLLRCWWREDAAINLIAVMMIAAATALFAAKSTADSWATRLTGERFAAFWGPNEVAVTNTSDYLGVAPISGGLARGSAGRWEPPSREQAMALAGSSPADWWFATIQSGLAYDASPSAQPGIGPLDGYASAITADLAAADAPLSKILTGRMPSTSHELAWLRPDEGEYSLPSIRPQPKTGARIRLGDDPTLYTVVGIVFAPALSAYDTAFLTAPTFELTGRTANLDDTQFWLAMTARHFDPAVLSQLAEADLAVQTREESSPARTRPPSIESGATRYLALPAAVVLATAIAALSTARRRSSLAVLRAEGAAETLIDRLVRRYCYGIIFSGLLAGVLAGTVGGTAWFLQRAQFIDRPPLGSALFSDAVPAFLRLALVVLYLSSIVVNLQLDWITRPPTRRVARTIAQRLRTARIAVRPERGLGRFVSLLVLTLLVASTFAMVVAQLTLHGSHPLLALGRFLLTALSITGGIVGLGWLAWTCGKWMSSLGRRRLRTDAIARLDRTGAISNVGFTAVVMAVATVLAFQSSRMTNPDREFASADGATLVQVFGPPVDPTSTKWASITAPDAGQIDFDEITEPFTVGSSPATASICPSNEVGATAGAGCTSASIFVLSDGSAHRLTPEARRQLLAHQPVTWAAEAAPAPPNAVWRPDVASAPPSMPLFRGLSADAAAAIDDSMTEFAAELGPPHTMWAVAILERDLPRFGLPRSATTIWLGLPETRPSSLVAWSRQGYELKANSDTVLQLETSKLPTWQNLVVAAIYASTLLGALIIAYLFASTDMDLLRRQGASRWLLAQDAAIRGGATTMGTMLPTVLLVAGLEGSTHLAHALGWMSTVLSVEWTQLLFPFGLVAIAVPTTMAGVALLTTRHPVEPSLTMPPTPTERRVGLPLRTSTP